MQFSSQQIAAESSNAISHSFSRDASMNASMGINASGIGIGNSGDSFVFTQVGLGNTCVSTQLIYGTATTTSGKVAS